MKAIFIDGPLLGEFRNIQPLPLGGIFKIKLPPKEVTCDCNPSLQECLEIQARNYEYYVIAKGVDLAFLSKNKDEMKALKGACSFFLYTNLDKIEKWKYHCGDLRAFE